MTRKKFYEKTWFVVLMLIVFWPVGVFLMWRYTEWNKPVKVAISVVAGIMLIYGFFLQKSNEKQVQEDYTAAVDYTTTPKASCRRRSRKRAAGVSGSMMTRL